jgi:hypothetical protein
MPEKTVGWPLCADSQCRAIIKLSLLFVANIDLRRRFGDKSTPDS